MTMLKCIHNAYTNIEDTFIKDVPEDSLHNNWTRKSSQSGIQKILINYSHFSSWEDLFMHESSPEEVLHNINDITGKELQYSIIAFISRC